MLAVLQQHVHLSHTCCTTTCLQVAEGLSPSHPSDFSYCLVPVMDIPGEDLVAHFDKSFKFIDEAVGKSGAVLVQ
jgi:hypothetical protein